MSFNHSGKRGYPRLRRAADALRAQLRERQLPAVARQGVHPPKIFTAEMDRAATAFLNKNPRGIEVSDGGRKADVSKIFEWYAGDFAGVRAALTAFIDKYRKPPLPVDAQISYQDYNWSLNAAD